MANALIFLQLALQLALILRTHAVRTNGDTSEELQTLQKRLSELVSSQHDIFLSFSGKGSGLQAFMHHSRKDSSVCFFVRVSIAKVPAEFAQWEAVASTWALHPADGTRVYYLVDYPISEQHKLPEHVTVDQLMSTPRTEYNDVIVRDNFTFREIFNSARISDHCNWIALTETDAYVNTGLVLRRLQAIDYQQPHLMGNTMFGFVHGSFRLFSAAAIPLITDAFQHCRPSKDYSDRQLHDCLASQGVNVTLKDEGYGNIIIENSGTPEIFANIGQDIAKASCNNVDAVHKLTPPLMYVYHKLTSKLHECM
jgi:hypothetical protein